MRKIIPQLTDIGLSALDLILQLENENTNDNDEILEKLSNSNLNKEMNFPNAQHTPQGYELDEIKWEEEEKKYPITSDLIPFKNSTEKFREEIKSLIAQADEKIISEKQ